MDCLKYSVLGFLILSSIGGCGDRGSGTPSSGLVVTNSRPASVNGTYALSTVTSTTLAGITQVKIADPTNASRSLQVFYNASNALTSLIYLTPETSPVGLMSCLVGDPLLPCPTSAIALDVAGKKITFTNANFTAATLGTGTLNGTVTW